MPTNSMSLAREVVGIIGRLPELRWAVLHREADLAKGLIESDIDIAIDRRPLDVIGQLVPLLAAHELVLVQCYPYDIAEMTAIIATRDGAYGMQLDLLCDNSGAGAYGLRTAATLQDRIEGERYPRLSELDTNLYLLRKRHVKGDNSRASEHREAVYRINADFGERRAGIIFSRTAARQTIAVLRNGIEKSRFSSRPRPDMRYTLMTLVRRGGRISKPAGHWISIDAAEVHLAHELHYKLLKYCIKPTIANTGWRQDRPSLAERAYLQLRYIRASVVIAPSTHYAPASAISVSGEDSSDIFAAMAERTIERVASGTI